MKKTVFILLFVLIAQMGISQILKVENGISISSLNKDFDHKIRPYQFMMDVEYCDKGWFNISSGIGKLTKGGSRGIPIITADGYTSHGNVNLYVDYLTLNSTFDVNCTPEVGHKSINLCSKEREEKTRNMILQSV